MEEKWPWEPRWIRGKRNMSEKMSKMSNMNCLKEAVIVRIQGLLSLGDGWIFGVRPMICLTKSKKIHLECKYASM